MNHTLQAPTSSTQQAQRDLHVVAPATQPRCYTVARICRDLEISRRTFFQLKRDGELPFLDELLPRVGKHARYRAEPIDRWFDGQWGKSKHFASARRRA